jgi:hypothetical protein
MESFQRTPRQTIDEAYASLHPLFESVSGAGTYHLSTVELELLHEFLFKLGVLHIVIIHRDAAAQQVHVRWRHVQGAGLRARSKFNDGAANGPWQS